MQPDVPVLLDEDILEGQVAIDPPLFVEGFDCQDQLSYVEYAQILLQVADLLDNFVETASDGERPQHVDLIGSLKTEGGQEDERTGIVQSLLNLFELYGLGIDCKVLAAGFDGLDGGGLEGSDGQGLVSPPVDGLEHHSGELVVDEVLHIQEGGGFLGLAVLFGLEIDLGGDVVGEGDVVFEVEGDFLLGEALVVEADAFEELDLEVVVVNFEAVVVLVGDVEDELVVLVLVAHGDGVDGLEGDPAPHCELVLEAQQLRHHGFYEVLVALDVVDGQVGDE